MNPRVLARAGTLLGGALAVALLAGCGDPALWARWQAQRALFRARQLELKVAAHRGSDAALDRVERRYREVLDAFPPERWAPAVPDTGRAFEVALAAGRAGLALARSEARRGRLAAAVDELARLEPRVARVPEVLLGARLARHDALEALGRFDEALDERSRIAATEPLADPNRSTPPPEVLAAPLALAIELRARGRDADAAEALRAADASFTAALAHALPGARQDLALGLAAVRAARGDAAGALVPLRAQMQAGLPGLAGEWAEVMGARALEAGAPDTALVYAHWAMRADDSRRVAGPAMLVAAQAWEKLGRPDSAVDTYDEALRHWTDPGVLGPTLRWRKARLLESTGHWDLARAEYLTLAARYPSHEYALGSGRRIVDHHLDLGQPELARVEGAAFITNLERVLDTNRDPDVQRQARAVRADLLMDLGRLPEAEEALLDQWRRYPADSSAQEAALRAATLARHRSGGGPRADSILSALRRSAFSATVRREAATGAAGSR